MSELIAALPIIAVKEARKIIGKSNTQYSDFQIEQIINTFIALTDLAIDSYLEKKEKKKLEI